MFSINHQLFRVANIPQYVVSSTEAYFNRSGLLHDIKKIK
jgi:hypothetical protein